MMMMNMMTEFYFVNQTLESMSWDGFTTAHLKHGLVLMAKTANFTSEETDWFLRLTMAHLHAPRTNSPAALWGVSDRLEKRARRKGLWNSEEPLVDDHVLQTLLHDNDNLVQEINKRAQAATLRSGHRHHIYLRDMDREQITCIERIQLLHEHYMTMTPRRWAKWFQDTPDDNDPAGVKIATFYNNSGRDCLHYCRIDLRSDGQFTGTVNVVKEPYQAVVDEPSFFFRFGPHVISAQDTGWPSKDDEDTYLL